MFETNYEIDEAISKNNDCGLFYDIVVEKFTMYVNECLRRDDRIRRWCFCIPKDDNNKIIVAIDYVYNFSSRDMYAIDNLNLMMLKRMFDIDLMKHFEELRRKI